MVNFRLGYLEDWRRIFAHAAPIFFERKIVNEETKEFSSLSIEPHKGSRTVIVLFEVKKRELPAFYSRELEFRFVKVKVKSLDGTEVEALACGKYSDEEYRDIRLKGDDEEYYETYGRWGIDKIWRDDIFPCRLYLRHCVLAAKSHGKEVEDNFLDHTFLGDRKTTIREWLERNQKIMEELPPPHLAGRYTG